MSNDPASPIGSHHQTVRSASDADLQSTLKSLDATEPRDRPAGLRDAIILEMGRRVARDLTPFDRYVIERALSKD
jgi:hypothetical protein